MAIVRAALAAVDPERLVERALASPETEAPTVGSVAGGAERPRYTCIAAGKAAHGMARAARDVLGPRIRVAVVIGPDKGSDSFDAPFSVIAGGHPTPTAGSEAGGRRALELARGTRTGESLLVLLSGGASSLMAAPAEGLTLDDKARTTDLLMKHGADIHQLNAVRKHLSAIKGGRLAAASAAPTETLAISDVVGDDLSVIASGPTVPDPTTYEGALAVLRSHGGGRAYPPAVVSHLSSGVEQRVDETPKPGDARLARSTARVIGGRLDAMQGAADAARARGYAVWLRTEPVVGDARTAAVDWLRAVRPETADRPVCIVASGETTVRVIGSGRGGRNQEFALAVADRLAALGRAAALASVGTDGVDGPTDAAGAIVDSTTPARAAAAAISAAAYLDNNDAYAFFSALGDLVHTGPTGTNVGDLQVLLLA